MMSLDGPMPMCSEKDKTLLNLTKCLTSCSGQGVVVGESVLGAGRITTVHFYHKPQNMTYLVT